MPEANLSDHDQWLKVLLKELFGQFFLCFFREWAERFDFTQVDWLDKEVFLAPPQGARRQLDLVAKLRLKPDAPPPWEGMTDLVALVHIEVEARDRVSELRPRLFDYYVQLRPDTALPVLPIGLFLRVGLEGIGWDTYEERFWEHTLVRFQYAYVGLPALEAEAYATGEHVLGAALSSLMKVSSERRAEVYAEGLKRIVVSGQNDYRRFLLAECLEAYAELTEEQKAQLQALLDTTPYQEVKPLMTTTFERGVARGREQGLAQGLEQGERRAVLVVLEEKFGPLPEVVKQRVERLSSDELRALLVRALKADSLKDLGLEE